MFWTRRNGHLSDEDLSAYIDGELGGARLQAADRHLAGCPACSGAVESLREVSALVSRLPEVEAPRSFALTPAMAASEQRRPQQAPRRQSFVFVPAVALTLLVALFAVDLVSSTSSSSNDESGTASQAMIAKDASSNAAADSSGGAGSAESPQRSTFSAPESASPAAAQPAQPVVPPSTSGPVTGQGIAPPTVAAPSTGPVTESAPSSSSGVPVPVPSTAPSSNVEPVVPQAPSVTGAPPNAGALSSEAAPAPLPDSFRDDGGTSLVNSGGDGGGTDWLRVAEVLAAIAFVASLAYVFGPGLIKKGH